MVRGPAGLTIMGFVIDDLPAASIDRLEPLWRELLDHHLSAAPHLASLGAARDPAGSWRVRRAQYQQWLADPRAAVLIAQDDGRPAGYAMIRAVDAAGSWQWGDRVGILETLVVTGTARGTGLGRELMGIPRAGRCLAVRPLLTAGSALPAGVRRYRLGWRSVRLLRPERRARRRPAMVREGRTLPPRRLRP